MNHLDYNNYTLITGSTYTFHLQAMIDDGITILSAFVDPASLTGKIYHSYTDGVDPPGYVYLFEFPRI